MEGANNNPSKPKIQITQEEIDKMKAIKQAVINGQQTVKK